MSSIAIIPARGGSKGIPKKNLRKLQGKPLIAHTIEQAFSCKYLDEVIVSTDDPEISDISKEYGAEIPFLRPKKLAEDDSSTIDVVMHSIDFLETNEYYPKTLVLLQPTSPLRTVEDIENALKLYIKHDVDSVVSVSEFDHSPYWSMKIENDYLKPNFGEKFLKMRRQDLPQLYMPNGSIYISSPEDLRKFNGFFGDKIIPYIMPKERSVDIDTMLDFKLAELLLGERHETDQDCE